MDNLSLNKYFSTSPDPIENADAYLDIRKAGRDLATVINDLLPDSASKADIIGRLFRIVVDSELAIRMDGLSKVQNMVVLTKQ